MSIIGALMLLAIAHLFLMPAALFGYDTAGWGMAEYNYVALMVLLSALVLMQASMREDVPRARTMIALACTIGLAGSLMALTKGWFMMIGLLYSEEQWKTYAVCSAVIISLLPFILPFATGVLLLRNDFEPARWRVRAVSITVAVTAVVIVAAALIPRWVRLAELSLV